MHWAWVPIGERAAPPAGAGRAMIRLRDREARRSLAYK